MIMLVLQSISSLSGILNPETSLSTDALAAGTISDDAMRRYLIQVLAPPKKPPKHLLGAGFISDVISWEADKV